MTWRLSTRIKRRASCGQRTCWPRFNGRNIVSKRQASLPKPARAKRADSRPWRGSPGVWILGGVLVVILVAAGVWLATRSTTPVTPGQRVPIQGQQHIAPGQTHPAYNSDPPTSGWHFDTPLPAGFYEEPAPDEQVIHNLEHGHVVISYDCSKLADCAGTQAQIRQLVERYRNWKVTAVPRQNADTAIALTAWGWIDKLDGFDEARITAFIDAWRDRGPEDTHD